MGFGTQSKSGSGGNLPPGGEFNPFPVARRVNSFHAVVMDDDMESGALGSYQDRLRTFPNMRSKHYSPLLMVFLKRVVEVSRKERNQNGLDTKIEKSRKQLKERKNKAKKIRGVKKTKASDAAKAGKKK